ncbi:DinB family protein [Chitinophagaceae bacterium LB-8]|uniref:DinB family protein n=1 Tax=Paraflavisolibacter caeni TaxID=2982496 RepID=A0A9X2XXF3_9BACT|nr:DinB family protein [Paraflavisolibacter caeni]MCU7551096.1 DinB family protein [Paraflavisolibacter caeni]
MNNEILFLIAQLKDAFEGEPWFGRPALKLLGEVTEDIAFQKPNGQHSIVELIWHMINWKEFAINCLRPGNEKNLQLFEQNDWRNLDHSNKDLFQDGIKKLQLAQEELVNILQVQQDDILENDVPGRTYSFRKLLHGVVQHDIYHLGQIAYIKKLLGK